MGNLPVHRPVTDTPKPYRPRWKRFLILASGWGFVFLGVLGIFLPVLQGILFLAIGFYLLSLESPRARRMMDKLRRRYPKLGATLEEARLRAARYARKIRRRKRPGLARRRRRSGSLGSRFRGDDE